MSTLAAEALASGDALVIVDVQNDFLPGGALPVPAGDDVVPVLNQCIRLFELAHLPVYATRDWHPLTHCSFREQGGPWPMHCVAGTPGASFAPLLALPPDAIVVSKATTAEQEAYSGFEGTDLARRLRERSVRRLFVGGLATDYCVLRTVSDASQLGFTVLVLEEAIRAVELQPGDGQRARQTMESLGARFIRLRDLGSPGQ